MPEKLIGLYSANARYYEAPLREAFAGRARVALLRTETELAAVRDEFRILVSAVLPRSVGMPGRLRLLHATGAGLDRIDMAVVPEACTICCTPGHEIAMGEYIVYAMLRLILDARAMEESFARGGTAGGAHADGGLHGELFGRTACFVGYGLIGREGASRARGMGMRIGVVTRSPQEGPEVDWWLPPERIREAAARSDVVVVACPYTAETAGMIDAGVIAAMKPDAIIVNVARAQIIDEDALHEALAARRIAGAALDVWYLPPPSGGAPWVASNRDFRSLPNVVATPHGSAWTGPLWQRRIAFVRDNVEAFLAGRPLKGVVRPGRDG